MKLHPWSVIYFSFADVDVILFLYFLYCLTYNSDNWNNCFLSTEVFGRFWVSFLKDVSAHWKPKTKLNFEVYFNRTIIFSLTKSFLFYKQNLVGYTIENQQSPLHPLLSALSSRCAGTLSAAKWAQCWTVVELNRLVGSVPKTERRKKWVIWL